jgi:stress response protein YsnF
MSNPTPQRFHPGDLPDPEEPLTSPSETATEEMVPLVEETASVWKREVVTGRVRVRTVTDMVEELARADLQQETVEVTRVPVDRVVDAPPEIRIENGVTIVPVVEEVLVVEKRLVLKEELHIRRTVAARPAEVPVTLRKQRAEVERLAPDTAHNPDMSHTDEETAP